MRDSASPPRRQYCSGASSERRDPGASRVAIHRKLPLARHVPTLSRRYYRQLRELTNNEITAIDR